MPGSKGGKISHEKQITGCHYDHLPGRGFFFYNRQRRKALWSKNIPGQKGQSCCYTPLC